MTTQEKIEIMKAYEEGYSIQWSRKEEERWYDIKKLTKNMVEPIWNWEDYIYRIKPEPKYRPYKDVKEMIDDYKERFNVNVPDYAMPLIWIQMKYTYHRYLINYFGKDYVSNQDEDIQLNRLYSQYEYLDGSPIGKLEE